MAYHLAIMTDSFSIEKRSGYVLIGNGPQGPVSVPIEDLPDFMIALVNVVEAHNRTTSMDHQVPLRDVRNYIEHAIRHSTERFRV